MGTYSDVCDNPAGGCSHPVLDPFTNKPHVHASLRALPVHPQEYHKPRIAFIDPTATCVGTAFRLRRLQPDRRQSAQLWTHSRLTHVCARLRVMQAHCLGLPAPPTVFSGRAETREATTRIMRQKTASPARPENSPSANSTANARHLRECQDFTRRRQIVPCVYPTIYELRHIVQGPAWQCFQDQLTLMGTSGKNHR